jgi:hypothetical protein
MSISSDGVVIPEAEVGTPGLYLFNQKELVAYLDMKAASKNMSLTPRERNDKRGIAANKLKKVIKTRMPMTEKLVLEAGKQAETDRKYQEKIQFIEKALSLCTLKQREDYDAILAGSTDPKKTAVQRRMCVSNAMDKLKLITASHTENEKRAAMTSEELVMYDNEPERVAAKTEKTHLKKEADAKYREKEAALCRAGDPDALARRADKNESNRKFVASANQAEEEKRAAMTNEELAMYDKDPERVAAKAENARYFREASAKHTEKEAVLRRAGDPDAIARQAVRNESNRKSVASANQAEEEKRAAMTPEELEDYDNDPERVDAKAEKTRLHNEASTKYNKKDATLRRAGDPDAIARHAAREVARQRKKQEMLAEIAELFRQHGGVSTVFGEGDERQESIMRKVKEIMRNYAGVVHHTDETTSKKWLNDHGDVSIEEKLAEGEWAAYILITRTGIIPGEEEKCDETKLFLTQVQRDPLWRMELENGDLKRMSPMQANSVVHSYLLAECDTAYDVTSLEAACQFYLEDGIGLPHGMCLHKQAGAGKRLENSMTEAELKLFLSGELKGWSLVLTMIRTTDRVFADVDPFDPERSPPLVSASVPTHDGTGTVYRIRVRGNKQSFPDTPSVVEDTATNKAKYEKDKARRQKRKRNAAESVDSAESPEETEEKTAKKSKV